MRKAILFVLLFAITFQVQAQLFIDNTYSIEEMVVDFFDNTCVTPSNITTTGTEASVAFFDAGGTDLGVQAGIFISTGNVFDAIGPNNSSATGQAMGIDGDADLNTLLGANTFDAVTIEMDILPSESVLDFSYVFASEEYPEYVGSAFNDVFAFFVSGPGLNGQENIALIPGTTQPVAINNVNANSNSSYYVDNTDGIYIEFDGFTTNMTAQVQVVPNETYHVKIVIADAMDAIFDSGIFLGVESLCGSGLLPLTNNLNIEVDDMTISCENYTKYASRYEWDFGDGVTSTEKNPGSHSFSAPGIYTVTLITSNFCCSDTTQIELEVGQTAVLNALADKPYRLGPNPVQDFLLVNSKMGSSIQVRLMDAMGKVLFQNSGKGTLNLEFSPGLRGLYLLEITIDGEVYLEKIVK